ncbi:competence protein CoiA family protein [Clostridium butyricum]|uniref:competence protein CoiA family protein n=1 Tax=Clostridium butyricum TaxID=1492 RepID=UPI00374EBA3C
MLFLLAERNNKIIHIDEIAPAENGLKCNCLCPICKEPLKANTLGKIKRKHFSHNINSNCINHLETVIHKFAKQILEDNKRIVIPKLTYNNEILVREQNIDFEIVELEKYLPEYSFKPDIIATKKRSKLIIEIAVTHKIDNVKLQKIKSSNISTIEIYLDPKGMLDKNLNEITEIILNDTANKRWIFNKYSEQIISKEKIGLVNQRYYKERKIHWSKSFFNNKEFVGIVYCPISELDNHYGRVVDIKECENNCSYYAGTIKRGWRKVGIKCKGN